MKSKKAKSAIHRYKMFETDDSFTFPAISVDNAISAVELAEQELTEQHESELKERIKEAREKAEYMSELVLEQCKNDMKEKAIEAYCFSQCQPHKSCYCRIDHPQTCDGLKDFIKHLNN